MFPEIILLRLELAIQLADEANGPAAPRFVPLPRGTRPRFKTRLTVV
jgi:hypothetical protein